MKKFESKEDFFLFGNDIERKEKVEKDANFKEPKDNDIKLESYFSCKEEIKSVLNSLR